VLGFRDIRCVVIAYLRMLCSSLRVISVAPFNAWLRTHRRWLTSRASSVRVFSVRGNVYCAPSVSRFRRSWLRLMWRGPQPVCYGVFLAFSSGLAVTGLRLSPHFRYLAITREMLLGFPRETRKPSMLSARTTCIFACVLVVQVFTGRAAGGDQSATLSFYAVSDLTKATGAQPSLRGARIADPKDWPASFYSVHPGGSCTSTLVGPRALLTAAHCTPNKGVVAITLGIATYRGTCLQSPLFVSNGGASADWAICLMETDVPAPEYESVNIDPMRLKVGTQLLLTGFGCTQASGTGGNDGHYRVGEVNVRALPSGGNNYITTSGEVALCFGDSGGPAFLFLDPGKTRRVQVSVNSTIQTLDNGTLGPQSSLSSLSTPQGIAFIRGWQSRAGVGICGVTPGLQHCR
jgi:hypothetical protein